MTFSVDDDHINSIFIDSYNISVITKIEFLSWKKLFNNKSLHKKAIQFISNATIYDLDEEVVKETIKNRQKYKIKTPDAIIGSTALVHGFDIITNNEDDFEKLNLNIINIKLVDCE